MTNREAVLLFCGLLASFGMAMFIVGNYHGERVASLIGGLMAAVFSSLPPIVLERME